MSRLAALLWDVDGTVAETERDGHRVAFNLAFEAFDLPLRWDEARYGELLRVAGGRERLIADLERRGEPATAAAREALAGEVHRRKNLIYAELAGDGRLALRPGVRELMDECEAEGVAMAITTTTSRSNLDVLLRTQLGGGWRGRFAAVVSGEDVARKKPDPEVYTRALESLGVGPSGTVAIEDSPDGARSATAAGVPVVVTRSRYFADAQFEQAIAVGPGLHTRAGWRPQPGGPDDRTRVALDDIAAWHERSIHVSMPG